MSVHLADGNVNLLIGDAELAELDGSLAPLEEEGARCAMLIDTAGKVVTTRGSLGHRDPATVAALAAGNHATTRALARRVGEEDFSLVFQREKFLNMYLCAVSPEMLLLVLFDEDSTLGGIRNKVKQALPPLRRTLARCTRTVTGPAEVSAAFGTAAAAPADAPPAAAAGAPFGAPAGGKPSGPPEELVRRFWRVRKLAEDCIRNGVDQEASVEWRQAAKLVAAVSQQLVEDRFDECARAMGEAERLLTIAYERAINLTRGDEDLRRVHTFLESLSSSSRAVFEERLGASAPAVVACVDEETLAKFPTLLAGAARGGNGLSAEQRRHILIRSTLDLLLSRAWVIFKIFGKDAARGLLGQWEDAARREAALVERLHLTPGLRLLSDEIRKRLDRPVRAAAAAAGSEP